MEINIKNRNLGENRNIYQKLKFRSKIETDAKN